MNIEQNTKHAARTTQVGTKTGREERGARRRGATRRYCRAPSRQVHMRGTTIGLQYREFICTFFFHSGGLSEFMVNTGGLSIFFMIPGVYPILP